MAPKRYAWSRSVEQKWFAVRLRRTQHGKSHDDIIAAAQAKFGQDLARSTLSQWTKQGDAIEAQFNATGSNEAKGARPAKNPNWSWPCSFGTRVTRHGFTHFRRGLDRQGQGASSQARAGSHRGLQMQLLFVRMSYQS